MLGLVPALFPPIVRELPMPNLELFDLDEEFASEKYLLLIFIFLKLNFYFICQSKIGITYK